MCLDDQIWSPWDVLNVSDGRTLLPSYYSFIKSQPLFLDLTIEII
jgi:hypothetical protein